MNERETIIKRHGKFRLTEMKSGKLFIKGKNVEFRVVRSLGKRYLILENEAIGFESFDELFGKLKERGANLIIAYDKYNKNHATILL